MASLKQKPSSIRSKSRVPAEDFISGTPIGEVLSQAREALGLTLDNVADELMIRKFYLDALENGAFHDLPERVYAIGFVKNYVKYLNMEDQQAVIEQFKREAYGSRNMNGYQVDLMMPEPVVHSIVPGRSAIVSALIVLAVLIAGIVFFTQSNNGTDKKASATIPAPVTASAPVVDAPVPAATPVVNTTTTEAPEFTATGNEEPAAQTSNAAQNQPAAAEEQNPALAQIKNQRAIEALQSAWVEIKDGSGKTLYTGILKATQLLPLPDNTKVTLTTGNAGGLRLILNGQPQPAFGQVNEVKRNIAIEVPVASATVPTNAPTASGTTAPAAPAAMPTKTATPSTLPEITFER